MKTGLLTGIRRFEIREIPNPKIVQDNDVLIRIKMVGICGSDIHYYNIGRIGSQVVHFPFIVGHETAGIVEKVGKKVVRVKPGQRIAIDPSVSCGHCDQCRAGRENTCRDLLFLGNPGQMEGALCEYIVLPENCCYPISDAMTFEQAVLTEPLAIAVYSVEKSHLTTKANVAILGVGPIGLSVFHVLRTIEIGNVYITDKIQDRLEFARQLKPRWYGNPDQIDIVKEVLELEPLQLDIVYECSGDLAAIGQAIKLLKPGGQLLLIGIPEVDDISLPIHEMRRREITIVNVRRQVHCTQKAIDLLERRKIKIDAMATHHFPLEDTQQAFELVASYRDGVMKVMIVIA
jgi:L-iditol 2-dehydrogenase